MSETEANRKRTGQADFNQIVVASVHETLGAVLGQTVSEPLALHLQRYLGISNDEMPSHIEPLFTALSDSFGISGNTLCKAIVKKMYKKAGVPFYEVGYRPMIEYVQELKHKLANIE